MAKTAQEKNLLARVLSRHMVTVAEATRVAAAAGWSVNVEDKIEEAINGLLDVLYDHEATHPIDRLESRLLSD